MLEAHTNLIANSTHKHGCYKRVGQPFNLLVTDLSYIIWNGRTILTVLGVAQVAMGHIILGVFTIKRLP